MKQYGKKYALMFLLLFGQLFSANNSSPSAAEKYFDAARGAGLRYNQPIVISSQGRTLWTHTMSRLRGNTDETRYNTEKAHMSIPANTPAPNDHFEVLVTEFNADTRLKNGACLFSLQKIGDLKNTGLVKSGDTVRIIALYAAAGHKEKEGVIPNGRILHVENSSRLGEHDLAKELSHFDTFASDASFPGTQDDGGKFILQGTQPGPLYAKDLITIQNKEYKRPLCAFTEGRWGNKFGELSAVRGLDTKDASTQFTMNLVDIDALSEVGQKNLKGVLSAAIQAKLFSLSPENTPGNTPFRFNPALHGGRSRALFNDPAWRFADANEGYIIFDVNPNGGSVKVVFSPGAKNSPEAYVLVIGDEKNSSTRLSKGDKVVLTIEGAKVSNAIFSDLGKSSSFWIKISGKVLTAGSGRELSKNEFLHFEETDAEAALVSFVGLAGSESALFENIAVNSKVYLAKLAGETKAAKDGATATLAATTKSTATDTATEKELAAKAADAKAFKAADSKASDSSDSEVKGTVKKVGKSKAATTRKSFGAKKVAATGKKSTTASAASKAKTKTHGKTNKVSSEKTGKLVTRKARKSTSSKSNNKSKSSKKKGSAAGPHSKKSSSSDKEDEDKSDDTPKKGSSATATNKKKAAKQGSRKASGGKASGDKVGDKSTDKNDKTSRDKGDKSTDKTGDKASTDKTNDDDHQTHTASKPANTNVYPRPSSTIRFTSSLLKKKRSDTTDD